MGDDLPILKRQVRREKIMKYTYVSEMGTRIEFNNLDDGKEDCLEFGGYIIDNSTGDTVYFVSDGTEED